MTPLELPLIEQGTGGGNGRIAGAAGKLVKFAPVGFVIAGALTGTTAALAPPSLLDWTSAGVHQLENPGAWTSRDAGTAVRSPALTATQILLESIKQDSGLTWGQVADAMGVEVRAVHLWRNGGGISAAHETRLHDFAFLVDSVRLREPSDVRSELVNAQTGQSLLDRFRAGAAPRELAKVAPWRIAAWEGLSRGVAARLSGDAVDEDFAFLLYADDPAVSAFASHAGALLDGPTTSRRDWEAEINAQFGEVEQPLVAEAAPTVDANGNDDIERYGAAQLFDLDDLGITLGVGAIASRPTVTEDR
jgi:hypothetical protein